MITAVDTNVLLDVLLPDEKFFTGSLRALESAAAAGSLVICDIVYAELLSQFESQQTCEDFLRDTQIRTESLTRDASFVASRAWAACRRRGGSRQRILPDFLVGAHASVQTGRLLTRDRGFFRNSFHDLRVIDPSV